MTEATTTYCSRCHAPLTESTELCPICGTPAPAAPEPLPDSSPPDPENSEAGHSDTLRGIAPSLAAFGDEGADPGEEPESAAEPPPGLVLDWEPELLELVEHAAEQQGLSCEEFILEVVEREARRLLAPEKPLVTLDEAASIFDLPRTEVIRRITAGKLRARKLGEEWMVELDEAPEKKENPLRQIRRELEQLVKTAGLTGLQTEGEVPDSISTTWCFVNQEQILVCPVAAWRKYGHDRVITEAKDALRRFRRRQDRELGHF